MSSGIIDLTIEISLPEDIKQHWIPLDGQSVPHLFQFPHYPPQHILYHNYQDLSQQLHGEKLPTSSHTLSSSLVPHHHCFLIDTRLQSKQPHLLLTPSPWLQSLAIQSDSPSGYWTTGEKSSMQWDIRMIGREHWYG